MKYLTKYLGLGQLMWSKVLEHKINIQLLKSDMFFECRHCLAEQTFFLLVAIFAFYLEKNILKYRFLASFTDSRRSFSKKIDVSDAKLTFKV